MSYLIRVCKFELLRNTGCLLPYFLWTAEVQAKFVEVSYL